jgi:phytoene dehydrogenase-like protein
VGALDLQHQHAHAGDDEEKVDLALHLPRVAGDVERVQDGPTGHLGTAGRRQRLEDQALALVYVVADARWDQSHEHEYGTLGGCRELRDPCRAGREQMTGAHPSERKRAAAGVSGAEASRGRRPIVNGTGRRALHTIIVSLSALRRSRTSRPLEEVVMHTNGSSQTGKSVVIIGGGIAGLCAGCYAQMNGYQSRIYEMHSQPGGLMTAWQRKGYTIDYCIHWLVGSSPKSSMHRLWREVGLVRERQIVDLDVWAEYESMDGRRVVFWRDLDRLEAHLCELAPADTSLIQELLKDIRRLAAADMPADAPPRELMGPLDMLRLGPKMLPLMGPARRWGKLTVGQLLDRFTDSIVRDALRSFWPPEMGAMALLFTFAWLHAGVAGYPIGGSLPLARNVERRYTELGGQIHYETRVAKILTERTGAADRVTGVELADGTQEPAEVVISAADGHATIYEMLDARYIDETLRGLYERGQLALFPPILFIGVGVARDFADEAQRISGLHFQLDEPIGAGAVHKKELSARIVNFDPTMAPENKTVITTILEADGEYWLRLYGQDKEAYAAEKTRIGDAVVRALDGRFPGLKDQVEMVDVATPATTVRYTGNWRASFEGWLPTPEYLTKGLPRRLPGLDDFYMAGQWVQPGGGLPTGVMTAREVLQLICKRDGVKFHTTMV